MPGHQLPAVPGIVPRAPNERANPPSRKQHFISPPNGATAAHRPLSLNGSFVWQHVPIAHGRYSTPNHQNTVYLYSIICHRSILLISMQP